jgi:hypothetical protein
LGGENLEFLAKNAEIMAWPGLFEPKFLDKNDFYTGLGVCTPEMLLKMLGSNPEAPFLIDMRYVKGKAPSPYLPMNEETIACNESCSCQDCVETCRDPGVYPHANGGQCVVGAWNCFHFIAALMFLSFAISVILLLGFHKVVMGTPLPERVAGFDKDIESPETQIGCIDAMRSNWETGLQYSF